MQNDQIAVAHGRYFPTGCLVCNAPADLVVRVVGPDDIDVLCDVCGEMRRVIKEPRLGALVLLRPADDVTQASQETRRDVAR